MSHLDIPVNDIYNFVQVLEIFGLEKRSKVIGERFVLHVRVDSIADILDEEVNEFEQLESDQL